MNSTSSRKGSTRTADIPAEVLRALSTGEQSSITLTEILAIDQIQLLRAIFPSLSSNALARATASSELGILKRMSGIGAELFHELGATGITQCQAHSADTVRGWACFMIGAHPGLPLPSRLEAIRPLADDPHFGVREWAWLALRPHLARELDAAIVQLSAWTSSPSEYLRRFACEALRPRGVWCSHIAELKHEPQRALPILAPLRADPAVYVQDSVANWLNDAGKGQATWVRDLCAQWLRDSPSDSTRRITQRALRNLNRLTPA